MAAPVFGRPDAAAAAKLFIVAAGKSEAVARCQPLFDALGQRTFIVAEAAPTANLVKLSGNFLIASVIEAWARRSRWSAKPVSTARNMSIFSPRTLFGAPVYKTYGALIAEERYHPAGFKAELGYKDVQLALSAAKDLKVPMPMASLIADRFLALIAAGGGSARLVGARPPRQARRRRDDDTLALRVRRMALPPRRSPPPEPAKSCPLCPRLVAFRNDEQDAHPDWFNGAVPSFGPSTARLLIVGLAPGLKGANRTGRPFFRRLCRRAALPHAAQGRTWRTGATMSPRPTHLELVDCMITNTVRCVPPQNKPTPAEIARCRQFLIGRIAALPNLSSLLAIGRIAHDGILDALDCEAARLPVCPWRASRAARRACPVRQLSLLAPEHQYRAAHHGECSRRSLAEAAASLHSA